MIKQKVISRNFQPLEYDHSIPLVEFAKEYFPSEALFKEKKHTINSLSQIKIPDPFLNENERIKEGAINVYDLGYTDKTISMW